MKTIILAMIFIGFTQYPNTQANVDSLHLLANKYNGRCFEDFSGRGVLEKDQCRPGGLRICYIRPICAYDDEQICTTIKSCNIWMSSDKVDEGFNNGRFKFIDCKVKDEK
jgi:hypothetical protein